MQFNKDPEFHIWPKATLTQVSRSLLSLKTATTEDVEARLTQLFPGSHPVFFSSGRSGLLACLSALQTKRKDSVWVPPYSSHCVWSTVGALGTPTTTFDPAPRIALAYHQWGYTQRINIEIQEIVEDSVDSLCVGTKSLAPNGGRFELFSLPKITGSAFGGFVLCREEKDRKHLLEVREKAQRFSIWHHLRRMSQHYSMQDYLYWSNTDAFNGAVPSLICQDALSALARWDQIIADRRKKLALLSHHSIAHSVDHIAKDSSRLPSCLLLESNPQNAQALKACGFELGERMQIRTENEKTFSTPRLLVPLHSQIPLIAIEKLSRQLNMK